jgi:hypothetical protein
MNIKFFTISQALKDIYGTLNQFWVVLILSNA